MPQKGFAHILLLLVLLVIIGVGYYLVNSGKINLPLPGAVQKQSEGGVDPKSEYKNPFDKTSQYVNPFSDYKNPIDDLK
ncbi:MAG: sporulation protein YjcZ [Candidatus Daviesbacteria bacterium]|nr:sporulation protein YjcZ [Candidatus Daviesbacteria bacterium]